MIFINASEFVAVLFLTITLLIPLASMESAESSSALILKNVLLRIYESSQFCALIAKVLQVLKLLFSMRILLCGCPGVYMCVPIPAVRFLNTLLWI